MEPTIYDSCKCRQRKVRVSTSYDSIIVVSYGLTRFSMNTTTRLVHTPVVELDK